MWPGNEATQASGLGTRLHKQAAWERGYTSKWPGNEATVCASRTCTQGVLLTILDTNYTEPNVIGHGSSSPFLAAT